MHCAGSPKRVEQARDKYGGGLIRILGTRGGNNVVYKWKGKSLIPPGMKHVTAVEEEEKRESLLTTGSHKKSEAMRPKLWEKNMGKEITRQLGSRKFQCPNH